MQGSRDERDPVLEASRIVAESCRRNLDAIRSLIKSLEEAKKEIERLEEENQRLRAMLEKCG